MIETEIHAQTADGAMTTFVVHPNGEGPFPVALLYIDGIGYREQVKENARRFAADGYYCVAPDLFYRGGTGLTFDMAKLTADGFKGPKAKQLMSAVASVTPVRVVTDTKSILAAVETNPTAGSGPKVCVSDCMGARVALRVASALPAFVETDQSATPESIDRFRDALETAGIKGTVERLPGTTQR